MKEILKDPLIIGLLMSFGALYLLIAFNYLSRNQSYALLVEQACICFFLIIIIGATGITVNPLTKLHPKILSNVSVTTITVLLQLVFYGSLLFILSSRFFYTLRDLVSVLTILLTRDPFLMATFMLIVFSFFWSDTPEITLKTSMVYIGTSLVAVYVGKQYSWQQLFGIAKAVTIVVLFWSVLYSLTGSGRDEAGSWVGIIGHKNQFSFVMVLSTLIWFINSLYSPRQRLFSIFVVMVGLVALIQGGSGASRVMIVCLSALWFYLGSAKKLPPQWAFVSVLLFLIVSVCLTIVVSENLEFIVVDTLNKDLTLTGRTDFWPLIIDKINERPFLGYGIDGFWQPWRDADNPARSIIVISTQFAPPHSHNGFLDIACDLGYVGLAIFVCSFFSSIAKAVNYLSRAPMPGAGLPLLLISYTLMTNLTETGLLGVTSLWFWYVVVAVRTSLDTVAEPVRQRSRQFETI